MPIGLKYYTNTTRFKEGFYLFYFYAVVHQIVAGYSHLDQLQVGLLVKRVETLLEILKRRPRELRLSPFMIQTLVAF